MRASWSSLRDILFAFCEDSTPFPWMDASKNYFTNLFDGAIGDAFFELDFDGLVAVLRVVHPDAGRDPLHVRPLLLVPDFVDGVQQPGVPCRRGLLFAHLGPGRKKSNICQISGNDQLGWTSSSASYNYFCIVLLPAGVNNTNDKSSQMDLIRANR